MNMQAIMMQAKKMQRDIEKTQNELESKTYEGKSQLVTAVVGGNNKLISINIDVDSIEQDDKEMLEDMHKRKIDMADEIFVINVGGYIGDSTKSEIEYAKAHGKKVNYLESK